MEINKILLSIWENKEKWFIVKKGKKKFSGVWRKDDLDVKWLDGDFRIIIINM